MEAVQKTPEREAFYKKIDGENLSALWDVMGELICFSAAVLYAFSGVYARSFAGLPPLKVATGQVTMGALATLPLMLIVDRPWRMAMPSAPVVGSLLAIALLGTALAYIVFFRLIGRTGAMNMSQS